jgi:pimeloyl-ACP methyl ester carboxylesterase
VLLHGGLGNSDNWAYVVKALEKTGRQIVLIDMRGHGRSQNIDGIFSYHNMAEDVVAVLEHLKIEKAGFVGWSDGAVTSLILADKHPERVTGVYYFACNMDESGALEEPNFNAQVIAIFNRHKNDYERLNRSAVTFDDFVARVSSMQKNEPNYTASDLKRIEKPVLIAQGEFDKFIKAEHAAYLALTIPGASLSVLKHVSHFAPLQAPEMFAQSVSTFFKGIDG